MQPKPTPENPESLHRTTLNLKRKHITRLQRNHEATGVSASRFVRNMLDKAGIGKSTK